MSDSQPVSPAKVRDVRLDFFRGASLLIIYVAHVPGNWLAEIIPARFGFSDAAHMFVFISGWAAAIAFGGTFLRLGFLAGTARIAFRCLQLYGAHIGLFVVGAALCAAFADSLGGIEYAQHLGLGPFWVDPGSALVSLFALAYVPPFFDILPLYMVVLAMVPAMMALRRLHPAAPIAASIALWLFVQLTGFALPSVHADDASWGFNPFAWQLIFFTGYSLSIGWLPRPRLARPLVWIATVYVAVAAAVMIPAIHESYMWAGDLRVWVLLHAHKPNLDLRQYLHFLALAIVVLAALEGRRHLLLQAWAKPFVKVGQQALIVFVSGMALAHLGGMVMATYGTGPLVQLLVNAGAFATLFAIAYAAAWFKNPPWKRGKAPAPATIAAAAIPPAAAPDAAPAPARGIPALLT